MDAIVTGNPHQSNLTGNAGSLLLSSFVLLTLTISIGCEGRTLVDDNPVFTAAPPRRSLVNESSVADSSSHDSEQGDGLIQQVASESSGIDLLEGNVVVAEVNGKPVFVDDVVGSLRLMISANEQLTDEQKQQILSTNVNKRLPNYVEQEMVLAEINRKVPVERQDAIRESMEAEFQKLLGTIKQEKQVQTDDQLDQILGAEGLSVALLRESFMRIQLVNGYLYTLAEPPKSIDRKEMVEYYQEHRHDYTPDERVHWQEIVVRYSSHGGRSGAEKRMMDVVNQLQNGTDFGELATRYSDSLSAERQGDMGWLKRGSLADSELEQTLFELPVGGMTHVIVHDDRFEVCRVINHEMPVAVPFHLVQEEIEETLKEQKAQASRRKILAELKERTAISTIFEGNNS